MSFPLWMAQPWGQGKELRHTDRVEPAEVMLSNWLWFLLDATLWRYSSYVQLGEGPRVNPEYTRGIIYPTWLRNSSGPCRMNYRKQHLGSAAKQQIDDSFGWNYAFLCILGQWQIHICWRNPQFRAATNGYSMPPKSEAKTSWSPPSGWLQCRL